MCALLSLEQGCEEKILREEITLFMAVVAQLSAGVHTTEKINVLFRVLRCQRNALGL